MVLDNVRGPLPGASAIFGRAMLGESFGQCNEDAVLTGNACSYRYRAKKDGVSLLLGVFWPRSAILTLISRLSYWD